MYIANRRMLLLPSIAIAMLLAVSALFGFSSTAQAQPSLSGEFCIEGIVIDWEEEPMEGITVTLAYPDGTGGSLRVSTVTDEDDDAGEFEFESPDDFPGVPGEYIAAVTLPGDDWAGVTPTVIRFNISATEDECVRIRFKLKQEVPVTVYKIDENHDPLVNWTIDAIPGGGNLFAEPQDEDTGPDGSVTFTLTPGVWVFMERPPEPDDDAERPDMWDPVVPHTGRMEIDVQPLDEGDPDYILVFKNKAVDNGCVVVRKFGLCTTVDGGTGIQQAAEPGICVPIDDANPEFGYGAAGWGFKLVRTDGSVARMGVTDAEGYITFENLPYGPYTIVEETRPGWGAFTPEELDIDVVSQSEQIDLTGDACLYVPFINEQDDSGYCIEGYKLDANGHYGLPDWEIEIEPVDEGGADPIDEFGEEIDSVLTDGLGYYRFDFDADDYRVRGASFEVCEDDDVDGWLPHTPTCQIVTLPKKPGECVQALDFINQQVGHSEKEAWDNMPKPEPKKPMAPKAPMTDNAGASWDGKFPTKGCGQTHVVMAGEGLFDIGMDYGVSAQAMVNANPSIMAPNYTIYVGQAICIP